MQHSLLYAIGRLWCGALCDIASNCVERFANGEMPKFAVRDQFK